MVLLTVSLQTQQGEMHIKSNDVVFCVACRSAGTGLEVGRWAKVLDKFWLKLAITWAIIVEFDNFSQI